MKYRVVRIDDKPNELLGRRFETMDAAAAEALRMFLAEFHGVALTERAIRSVYLVEPLPQPTELVTIEKGYFEIMAALLALRCKGPVSDETEADYAALLDDAWNAMSQQEQERAERAFAAWLATWDGAKKP
jgi:hypothetical protein